MPRKEKPKGTPIAVIDNTLLSRLAELDLAEHLPLIFKKIRIPPEIKREAYDARKRGRYKKRLRNLLGIYKGFFVDCFEADIVIKELLIIDIDKGEAAVIAQAEATKSVVITDDKKGVKAARQREIEVFRTPRIICLLKEFGQISLVAPYLKKLIKLGFRFTPKILQDILTEADELESLKQLVHLLAKQKSPKL
jgi:predicted nucleic acid-binding protein